MTDEMIKQIAERFGGQCTARRHGDIGRETAKVYDTGAAVASI
jgi:hypothetical protein